MLAMPLMLPTLMLSGALASPWAVEFDPWFQTFRRTPQIDQRLDELAALSPMAQVASLGDSIEGRAIQAISIGHGGDGRPTLVVIGTQHAREWISPMVTTCIADGLTRGWEDGEPEVVELLDNLDVVVVPVVNPDGYEYSWDVDRFWRKNRRPGGGVDLNRNWDAMWGTGVAGAPPNSEVFPGTAAFSEPETEAVRAMVEARNVVGFVDYHSPIAVVLYPFAYTPKPGPQERVESSWAEAMAEAITAVHGVSHGTGKPGVGNPSGGLAQDWAHGNIGALAWTVELRGGSGGSGFILPEEQIIPACEENFAGLLELGSRLAMDFGEPPPSSGDSGTDTGDPGGTADDAGTQTGPPSMTSGVSDDAADDGTPTTGGASATGSTPPMADGSDDAGCGCTQSPHRHGVAVWAWMLVLGLRRRTSLRSVD
ncbi:MAG: hypothetical protein K0V04_06085 [Deltaproteobacteria bacterium]|nr:hypothetical protein [Deltaproteobacteria bacterium]